MSHHYTTRIGATVLAVAVSGLALAVIVATGTARADENLEWDTTLTYRLDADDGAIVLNSDITVTNRQPNSRQGNTIVQYYFDRIGIYIPMEAEDLVVTSGDRELGYELLAPDDEDVEDVELLEIRLPRRLFYNRSTDVSVEYRIPGHEPRSESVFRVNPAYASFGVWAWGDSGRIEVRVVLDEAFDVTATGSPYELSRDGSDVIYTATAIDDPDDWYMYFIARNDDRFETTTLSVGEHDVVVRSWPGDSYWKGEVEAAVATGVSVLKDIVGLEWKVEADLTVSESIEPDLLGYGGWYLDTSERIEIGEWVDPHLVLHEIGHTWFNDDLFEERWITEGLADEFAAVTVERLNERSGYERETPVRNSPYSFPLNEWLEPTDFDLNEEKLEEYGYETSWWAIHELVEEIGIDGLRTVVVAADGDEIAYRGQGTVETVDPADDWRRFLDLLEEVGGSENASALFAEWVVADDDLLRARTETRSSYAALVDQAEGWGIPFTVRTHMSSWDFATAEAAIDEAEQVIATRERIEANVHVLDAEPPVSLEDAFETATEDLDAAREIADRQLATTETLVATRVRVDSERGLFQTIGLIGEHPDEDFEDAIAAFEADQLDVATSVAGELDELLDNADAVGVSRIAKASAALVLTLVLVTGLLFWARHRRRARAPAASTTEEISSEPAP